MRLEAGMHVGPYEILAPLGAGGMGEVYRARDARLAREVALKVLPARVAEDADALSRFEREARAVAALSHPNILAIFDFGHHDGIVYAVTERLEGETLRERLKGGGLPGRKAAEYALQMAHGLAAAHEKGIVHRDLKPENVFLTRDGRLKVLDFGLARQSQAGALGSDSASPTEAHQTEPGTLLGTVSYMSPEQVRGKTVDHRSDIFSLGAVLHEMATGERAFGRETTAETMSAILRDDPLEAAEPGSRSARLTPGLERVVRHCLEKSPDERFQSARDLAFDLEALTGSHSRIEPSAASDAPTRWRVTPLVAGAAALAMLVFGFGLGRLTRREAPPRPAPSFTQLTFQVGMLSDPVVSPEGQSFAFVAADGGDRDIFVQRLGGTNAGNLTADSPVDDGEPAFSPDGSQIAFRSERGGGGIFVMGATGESVRRLTDLGHHPAWSPDGREIVYSTEGFGAYWPYGRSGFGELWVVTVASGEKRRLTRGGPLDAVQPSWSPRGDRIAYWGLRPGGQRDMWTGSRSGAEDSIVPVTDDIAVDWNPVWSPDGRFLYFASDRSGTMGLWRVGIDEATGRTRGQPEALSVPTPFASSFSFTRDGKTLLLASVSRTDSIERVAFDPAKSLAVGELQTILATSLRLFYLCVAGDGRLIAFTSAGRQEDLYTIQADGTGLRQLTNDTPRDRGPGFFPDGEDILFYSTRSGRYEAWSVRRDGSRLTQLTRSTDIEVTGPVLSPDGSRIALNDDAGVRIARVGPTNEVSPPEPLPLPGEGARFEYPSWSMDGRKLAGILTDPSGRQTLAIYDLDSKSYRVFEVDGTDPIAWLNDEHLLFWSKGRVMTLEIRSGRAREVELPGGRAGADGSEIGAFALPSDRRTLFLLRARTHADVYQLTLP